MKISVIIPTFNRADLVCQAIDSVLQQTQKADEIIVVDDGSTDDTQKRLQQFGSKVKMISKSNGGISSARNAGIEAAHQENEWIAFLDSDDLWKPGKLVRQKQALAENPDYLICYTDEEWRKNNKWLNQKKVHQKSGGWIYELCLPRCIISPSSVLIHRSVFAQIGTFDETLPACEDYDLWLRVSRSFPVLYIGERLIIKRHGPWEQLSKQHSLDKYRIRALSKMLETGIPDRKLEKATRDIFLKKCKIYRTGCEKHNRFDEIEWTDHMVEHFKTKDL